MRAVLDGWRARRRADRQAGRGIPVLLCILRLGQCCGAHQRNGVVAGGGVVRDHFGKLHTAGVQ